MKKTTKRTKRQATAKTNRKHLLFVAELTGGLLLLIAFGAGVGA